MTTNSGVHIFGDWELSDVTIVVGGMHFKCHKLLLATASPYFRDKFFNSYGLNKYCSQVTVGANPLAFYHVMEVIYTGHFSGWQGLLNCMKKSERQELRIRSFENADAHLLWKRYSAILKAAEKFGIMERVVVALERYFLRSGCYGDHGDECGCGVKLIIAVIYGMEEYKEKSTATRNAVMNAISVNIKLKSILALHPLHLQWLHQRP